MEPKDIDFIKKLEDIKDEKSSVEIRLFDHKHSRVAYKTLTYKELFLIEAGIKIKWNALGVKG